MKSIEIKPADRKTCLTREKEDLILSKAYMDSDHSVGFTCNYIVNNIFSII